MREAQRRFLITRPSATILGFFVCLAACIASPCLAHVPQADSVVVPLLVRPVAVSDASTRAFWSALASAPTRELHGLVSVPRHPSSRERELLREIGVVILTPLTGKTYWALVKASADTSHSPIRPLRFALMEPRDRVAPRIWNDQLSGYIIHPARSKDLNYVVNSDSTLNLLVIFHEDASIDEAEEILRNGSVRMKRLSDHAWTVVTNRDQVRKLAESDRVHWIDAALAPLLPDNDKTRAVLNIDVLQNFNTLTGTVGGLGGKNVIVGVFDMGIDETHDDFAGRIIQNDAPQDWHATHVAGVIAGDGKLSAGSDSWGKPNGGSAYKWRGMAPQAQLIDADANFAFSAQKMLHYIATTGMDISNHSYSYDFDGAYTYDDIVDELIAGHSAYGGVAIPARLNVYSTGNHGQQPTMGGEQTGFFSLTKQSKNGLMVGNYDPTSSQIEPNSSLGPAYDGRIKPDVVAPGTNVWSTAYCSATNDPFSKCVAPPAGQTSRSDFYQMITGSSDAAAAVTGMLALVLQQHSITYATGFSKPPLPSTLRAITVHTAHDITSLAPWFTNGDGPVQAFPGPDFVTGYGMVDARAAVGVVKSRQYIEDVIPATCDSRTWWVRIKAVPELRVTLAWDDVPGDPALPPTTPKLVNDLDLELVGPGSETKHYPWLLDQQAVDAAGHALPDKTQTCGTNVIVVRKVLPTATPNFISVGNPSNVNDALPAGVIQPAATGKDHLNNIEQVVVASPAAGWWQARVTGFNVPKGPQSFSLVFSGRPAIKTPLVWFCGDSQACKDLIGKKNCERLPKLCDPLAIEVFPGHLPVQFRDKSDLVFVPINRVCLFLVECPICAGGEMCRELDVRFEQMPLSFTIEVYDKTGTRVFSDLTDRRTKRVRFPNRPGQDYLLVIGPARGVELGTLYDLPIKNTRR